MERVVQYMLKVQKCPSHRLPEQLQEETSTHQQSVEALNQRLNTEAKPERKILELRKEAKKQQQWYEEQLDRAQELAKQTEKTLNNEIARLEDFHAWETRL